MWLWRSRDTVEISFIFSVVWREANSRSQCASWKGVLRPKSTLHAFLSRDSEFVYKSPVPLTRQDVDTCSTCRMIRSRRCTCHVVALTRHFLPLHVLAGRRFKLHASGRVPR